MSATAELFLAIGGFLLLGLFTDYLGRHTFLPRVTLLMVFGIIIGPHALDLIPDSIIDRFELIANITLLMVGFLLGGKLSANALKNMGRELLWISVGAVLGTVALVALGLIVIGVPLPTALLLGCIATATAPAATVDVVNETGARGKFSDLLLSIVAVDDAWGLIIFSIGLAFTAVLLGTNDGASSLGLAMWEIGGAIFVGLLVGLPAAYLTGRVRDGEPMLIEALGIVFLCGGLAFWLHVSYLIAAMVMGAAVVNLARHHDYPFHAIEGIEWPFMIVFFVLAGASAEFNSIVDLGLVGLAYIVCRILGKVAGAGFGAVAGDADPLTQRWIGVALLPQAGVAIGMALVATNALPIDSKLLLTVVISSTVFFELIGPIFTRLAIRKATTANGV